MKAKGKENCTNCAYHQEFKYFDNDTKMQMRCWEHPDVCDHAFVQSMKKAEKYVCVAYMSYEAKAAEDYKEAKMDYIFAKKRIAELEKKYPELKDLTEEQSTSPDEERELTEERTAKEVKEKKTIMDKPSDEDVRNVHHGILGLSDIPCRLHYGREMHNYSHHGGETTWSFPKGVRKKIDDDKLYRVWSTWHDSADTCDTSTHHIVYYIEEV